MSFIEGVKEQLAEILFPPFCVSCNEPGAWWCEACRTAVQCLNEAICPYCLKLGSHAYAENLGDSPVACDAECAGSLVFSSVTALGYYHDPKLRSVITALKFNGISALVEDLRSFVVSRSSALPLVDVIIAMPLSDKRLRERGFNQATLIATIVAQLSVSGDQSLMVEDVLVRAVDRVPQSSLEHSVELRQANVTGVFKCNGTVQPNILLIDDVVTTGATANEAAKALLAAGAQSVHLMTLAIGA